MSDTTPRLALPLLQPAQAQKELFHNEALALLDLAAQPAVEAVGLDAPPASPAAGQAWIVGRQPAGDWADHAGALAGWTDGGWRFVAPFAGAAAWSRADGCEVRYVGSGWETGLARVRGVMVSGLAVLGERQPGIAEPAGGASVDAEARATLAAVLAALRAHGLIAA